MNLKEQLQQQPQAKINVSKINPANYELKDYLITMARTGAKSVTLPDRFKDQIEYLKSQDLEPVDGVVSWK